jgi:hypothetical protein
MDLDFMPSPVAGRPGLLIRDTYGYSEATLIIPPVLVRCLQFFDGAQSGIDLRAELVRLTGELDVSSLEEHLVDTLSTAGFLENEIYYEMREGKIRAFRESAIREANHVGTAYPDTPDELRSTLSEYMESAPAAEDGNLVAIAAPHVSPFGGWESYRAAFSALGPAHADRTFVILGTSHYGEPDKFGLTRKQFETPYGPAQTDLGLVDELANEPAALLEDYCHAVEHSIEFQVLFLQHLYGPSVKILPILCGSFGRSIHQGVPPESNEEVRSFIDRLGNIGARESDRLLWVLGIDMAHMGRRYHDKFTAQADQGLMLEVAERDRKRIERINASDAAGFWDLVQENHDDLKWCGSSPLYTFLKAKPGLDGKLRGYQQWNIDPQSVVSFAGLSFTSRP